MRTFQGEIWWNLKNAIPMGIYDNAKMISESISRLANNIIDVLLLYAPTKNSTNPMVVLTK